MELKYITYSELLCNKLASLGFKRKNKSDYVREYNGFVHTLSFCHSSYIPHTRDYHILVEFSYPKMEKLARELEAYVGGAWTSNVGYLTPNNNFQQWNVPSSATEDDVRETVYDMIRLIETYAIPYLNKLSDMNVLLLELEEGNSLVPRHADYNLPMLYYLIGENENARFYIEQELKKKESRAKRSHEGNSFDPSNNNIRETPLDREYNEYKEFADKLMARIKQEG